MTSARFQPICSKYTINIGYYDGYRIYHRNITDRNIAIKMLNHHFCLIWKSDGFSFKQAIKELKHNFKVVDSVISDKHVKSFF